MAEQSAPLSWVIRAARVWSVAAALLVGLAATALTVHVLMYGKWVIPWILSLAAVPVLALWICIVRGVIEAAVGSRQGVDSLVERMKRLESLTEAIHLDNRELADLSRMSETAKSLLFRDRESEAMNDVLHDYLIRQDYASAEALISDIEKTLGRAEQVQRMRADLAAARTTGIEQKVDASITRIDRFILEHDWAQAWRNAQRLAGVLPDNPKVKALPARIREARMRHKRSLLQDYGEAIRAGDVDRSIELIRELDKYLTPQEAAALEESARGAFRAKLHNLGVQFAITVTEENWPAAISTGEQIIAEYPNTRMAQEVRQKMDQLRSLAEQKK